MALSRGTSCGFVTTSPTADPAGGGDTLGGRSYVFKDTSPAGAIKITEIGFWCINPSAGQNFEIGLYAADGAGGSAGTRLQVAATNSISSGTGWKKVTVNWTISAGTAYWLGVQLDGTTAQQWYYSTGTGSYQAVTSSTALPSPWSDATVYTGTLYSIYALVTVAVAPTVTTQAVSSIAQTTATGNGNVTADGGATITERGTVISTSANPTTGDHKDTAAGTTGAFTTSITGLLRNTLYHVRAFATNSVGTSYGADVTFTTLTGIQINIGDTFKPVSGIQINISDVWKPVTKAQINIGDVWKTIF